jgi:hypothetical protein
MVELVVAIAILAIAVLPLAYSLSAELKLARDFYQHAVAASLVDGEFEVLAAGAWRDHPQGSHSYIVRAASRTNLPPGEFVLTISGQNVRLEWRKAGHAVIWREALLP